MNVDALQLLVNPTAGRGRAGKRQDRIAALLRESGADLVAHTSDAVGGLESTARRLADAGCKRLIVAGGDGSVHEAVNGLFASGSDAALAIIPTGTGNDFAKAAGIPLDWEHAARLAADRLTANASPRRIDVGRCNGRYFANGAGIGFDARVTEIARSIRLPIGDLVYLIALIRAMQSGIETPRLRIECEDFEWDGPATLANVGNGAWIGGMFHIAPGAKNDDGRFDLVMAEPVSRLRVLKLLPLLLRGQHLGQADIRHVQAERLTIRSDEALLSHLDGEVQPPQTLFEIELLPAALRLL